LKLTISQSFRDVPAGRQARRQRPIGERGSTRAALFLVRAYQVTLSPVLGGQCRFTPTCSAYAAEAISTYGAMRGLWLALKRLARCHPWGGFGHDPVPAPSGRQDQ
jgi:putative membrane protein insertion efficiency factor